MRQVVRHCGCDGFCITQRFMALQSSKAFAKVQWLILALTDATELLNTTWLQVEPRTSMLSSVVSNVVKSCWQQEEDEPIPIWRY